MLSHLDVPDHLHRNAPDVASVGYENTGQILIDHAMRCIGIETLADKDVLDVGCGVRFVQTIINRAIPIRSYSGLEVCAPVIDFLDESVARHDPRFHFARWNVRNAMYNPDGPAMSASTPLPFAGRFDVIWLFSVFTHLDPQDTVSMLSVLRGHIRDGGALFFSAFVDEKLDGYQDRVPDRPLLNAYYGRSYLSSLIARCGWSIVRDYPPAGAQHIQHHFACVPDPRAGREPDEQDSSC